MRTFLALILMVWTSACTTVLTRSPAPEDQIRNAAPYGIGGGSIPIVRVWGDSLEVDDPRRLIDGYAARLRRANAAEIAAGRPVRTIALTLSGGGPDGAFGAGLLKGWTERGDRPQFDLVTGISTGAIIAVFAFLGPDYDHVLEEIYTSYSTDDILTTTIFAGLTGGTAVADTSLYRRLIEKYVTDAVVAKLAAEAAKARILMIGTTNLDAARPVIWDVTRIAATGHPDARRLIIDVIQASSAIPVAFPPVLIPVEAADGRRYDEMHVDGGATQQVMLFSPELPLKWVDDALGVPVDREVYIIINNKLKKPYQPVRPRLTSIAGSAIGSLLGGSGTGDIYKIFAIAQRDGIGLNVTWIPKDFDAESEELFDPAYMKALFKLGYARGLSGDHWSSTPPDFTPLQ